MIEARLKRARILDAGDRMVVETVTRGGMLAMPEIGVEIPIDEVYRGVEPEGGDTGAGGRGLISTHHM